MVEVLEEEGMKTLRRENNINEEEEEGIKTLRRENCGGGCI